MACEDVQYKQAQPVNEVSLNTISREFIGTYISDISYLLISKSSFTAVIIHGESGITTTIGNFGDNAILKKYDHTYYLSLKDDSSNHYNVASFELNQKKH